MFLTNPETHYPIIDLQTKLPPSGVYLAKIVSATLYEVEAEDESQQFCLALEYLLVSESSLDIFSFTETIYPFSTSQRGQQYRSYLENYYPNLGDFGELEETREKLFIEMEVFGGFAYPVVTQRTLIARSPFYEPACEDVSN